ncbi:hypothetical protein [Luteimicrobium subarcticum]|uniref:Uncharacterized protein n=1 Tax=Luteimicrobium subarcticum TaxID=620910 RepID=A0A2M8W6R9_9MICO|nr:hypothetical protein [Luteimicrobium subarcticum]PJI86627.1 hypothetical protein CLV34_2547 [Luteimicrobium subarcticum]
MLGYGNLRASDADAAARALRESVQEIGRAGLTGKVHPTTGP